MIVIWTFVRHSNFSCLADDLWNVFCLFNFGGNQFFKLCEKSTRCFKMEQMTSVTRDIFTDCERA